MSEPAIIPAKGKWEAKDMDTWIAHGQLLRLYRGTSGIQTVQNEIVRLCAYPKEPYMETLWNDKGEKSNV